MTFRTRPSRPNRQDKNPRGRSSAGPSARPDRPAMTKGPRQGPMRDRFAATGMPDAHPSRGSGAKGGYSTKAPFDRNEKAKRPFERGSSRPGFKAPFERGSSRPQPTSPAGVRDGRPARRPDMAPTTPFVRTAPMSQVDVDPLPPHIVFGKRPVAASLERARALETPQMIKSLHVMGDEWALPGPVADLVAQARALGIKVQMTPPGAAFVVPDAANHQRVALTLADVPVQDESSFLLALRKEEDEWKNLRGCVGVLCDQIQDPQNFGAILRTAAFFGCRFVAFAKDRQAPLSGAALRASAGGAVSLDLVRATNLSRLARDLKQAGLWIVTSSCDPKSPISGSIPLDRPYVVIVGNEERGVRPDLAKQADFTVRIPGGRPMLDSLNVSVATGVLLASLSTGAAPQEDAAPEV